MNVLDILVEIKLVSGDYPVLSMIWTYTMGAFICRSTIRSKNQNIMIINVFICMERVGMVEDSYSGVG